MRQLRLSNPSLGQAMSLVEAIIALSLVGLIFLFLLGLLPSSAFVVRRSEQQLAALSYAEEIIARLSSLPFEELKASLGTLSPDSAGILTGHLEKRRLEDDTLLVPEVVLGSVNPVSRLLQAKVKVSWRSNHKDLQITVFRRFSSILR